MAGRQSEHISDPIRSEPLPKVPCRRALSNPVEALTNSNKNNVVNYWPNGDASLETQEPLKSSINSKSQHPTARRVVSESAVQGQSPDSCFKRIVELKIQDGSSFALSRKSSRCAGHHSSSDESLANEESTKGEIELVSSERFDERLSERELDVSLNPRNLNNESVDINPNVELKVLNPNAVDALVESNKTPQNQPVISDNASDLLPNPTLNSVSGNSSSRANCFECCVML